MNQEPLILGIDGGGTKCRARLCGLSGAVLGEAVMGPANVRLDLDQAWASAGEAVEECLRRAHLAPHDRSRITACLAFAGATEPTVLDSVRARDHPFARAIVTSDGYAACIGAHRGRDGGVVAVGTGLIGWAVLRGTQHRVGGWGFPVSDEGSGAWIGCEALRRALWAHDGKARWTGLLRAILDSRSGPHEIVRWSTRAQPRDYAAIAPTVVEYASRGDPAAVELMELAASHVDATASRLLAIGVPRLAVVGGLSSAIEPWLSSETKRQLTPACGDALDGAVRLARAEVEVAAAAG